MKLFLLSLFFPIVLFGQTSFKQRKVSERTLKIAKKIEKVNILMGSAVGFSVTEPEQYSNYLEFEKKASQKELFTLLNYPNGVVRCYAFNALCSLKYKDIFGIVIQHLNDTTIVETQYGCVSFTAMVGDVFLESATFKDFKNRSILDSLQIHKIDSIAVYSNSKLHYKNGAITRMLATTNNYDKIKQLAIHENNETALIKLAEYKRENDITHFLNFYNSIDTTVKEYDYNQHIISFCKMAIAYPHPGLFTVLKKELATKYNEYYTGDIIPNLYLAIASYQNTEAIATMSLPFTEISDEKIKHYHLGSVVDAISEFPNIIYDDLLWRIWETNHIISTHHFRYLYDKNPEKAYALLRADLNIKAELTAKIINIDISEFSKIETYNELKIRLFLKNEKQLAQNYIIQNIEKEEDIALSVYLRVVNDNLNPVFIDPLLKRLETEWNFNKYNELAKTLLLYKDDKINSRILQIVSINDHLPKWDMNALNKLLEE